MLDIKSGKKIRNLEIKHPKYHVGCVGLMRIRTGTFMFTKQLVRVGTIPNSFKNKCVCCAEDCVEDAEHMLLWCKAFNTKRQEIFPSISRKLQNGISEEEKIKILKKLLGEEGPASGRKTTGKIKRTSQYLTCILPKRSAFIAERKGVM